MWTPLRWVCRNWCGKYGYLERLLSSVRLASSLDARVLVVGQHFGERNGGFRSCVCKGRVRFSPPCSRRRVSIEEVQFNGSLVVRYCGVVSSETHRSTCSCEVEQFKQSANGKRAFRDCSRLPACTAARAPSCSNISSLTSRSVQCPQPPGAVDSYGSPSRCTVVSTASLTSRRPAGLVLRCWSEVRPAKPPVCAGYVQSFALSSFV